jgi:O-succinylbenzoic acid--CoA ligase
MTRELRVVSGVDATWHALREALTADGPAILPRADGEAGRGPDAGADGRANGGAGREPDGRSNGGGPVSVAPSTVDRSVCVVIETSGTSGRPKQVALTANALLASAAASTSALGGNGQWLLALPPHYIAGVNVLVRSIAAQIDPVAMEPGPFTAESFARATDKLEGPVAFTSLVPAQLVRLLAAEEGIRALRRFSRVLVGGQATDPGVLVQAADLGVSVTRTYGSSETSGGCVYDGVPIGQARVRVRHGQIEISGPMLAEGYLGDPARTDAAFISDEGTRWYLTGDSGALVGDVLTVTGRLDDVFISGGVKISRGAVEAVVHTVPGLSGAVVFREANDEWGEVSVIASTIPVDLAVVRAAVAASLGKYARPARVVVVSEIPLLPSGKPDVLALSREHGRNAATGQ